MIRRHVLGLTVALTLSGCAMWPAEGQGGDADRYAATHYYEPAATLTESVAYLQSQLETLQVQLDVLSMQGAEQCLPASVRRLSLLGHRVRRQIEGRLLADAGHDLVIYQRELRFLRQQFLTVATQTSCHQRPQTIVAQPRALLAVYFDLDSAELSAVFQQQLDWWLSQDLASAQWQLVGYTDSNGSVADNDALSAERVETVRRYLLAQGVPADRIQAESRGEQQLALQGADAFSMGFNRRVDVYLLPAAEPNTALDVQQWQSLELQAHRQLWSGWE